MKKNWHKNYQKWIERDYITFYERCSFTFGGESYIQYEVYFTTIYNKAISPA